MINENVINNDEIFVNHRMIPLKDVYEHSKIAYSIGYNNGLFVIIGFDKESEQKKPFNKIHFYYRVENDVFENMLADLANIDEHLKSILDDESYYKVDDDIFGMW